MAQGDGDDDGDGSESRYRREDGDPVRLRVASNGTSWILNMGMELREAGISGGDYVEVDFLWDEDGPMLLLGKIPSDEADDSQRARKVSDRGSTLSVKPPKEFLEDDPEFGLGLDIDTYDNDNPVLLDSMVTAGSVGLVPLGFADELEELSESETETETAAEAATEAETEADVDGADAEDQADTSGPGHPVGVDAVTTAAQLTGIDEDELHGALETLQDTVTVDDVEAADDFEPLDAGDRVVIVVEREAWERLEETLGLDHALAEAARMAHTQQAEDLAVDYGGDEFRRFSRQYSAVVFDAS